MRWPVPASHQPLDSTDSQKPGPRAQAVQALFVQVGSAVYCARAFLEFVVDAPLDEMEFAFNLLIEIHACNAVAEQEVLVLASEVEVIVLGLRSRC
jgi:hypothetical protein